MDLTPERLSSLQTFFFKFIFSLIWIGGIASATSSMWIAYIFGHKSDGGPPEMKFVLLAMTIAGSAYIYWSCIRLKKVRMDQQFLYISNYIHEIQVPLSMVERVTEFRWDNTHPVTIHFVRATEFGQSITFMPKIRVFGFLSSHPVVDKIRTAANLNYPGI